MSALCRDSRFCCFCVASPGSASRDLPAALTRSIATDSYLSRNGLLVSVPSPGRLSRICNGGPRQHLHTPAGVGQGSSTPSP